MLLPAAGAPSLNWPNTSGMRSLVARAEGSAVVIEGNDTLGTAVRQRWEPGGVCAICGGSEGPTGQRACSDPLPSTQFCAPPNDK